jgi:hypothetical protein
MNFRLIGLIRLIAIPTLLLLYGIYLRFWVYGLQKSKRDVFGFINISDFHLIISLLCFSAGLSIVIYQFTRLILKKKETSKKLLAQIDFFLTEGSALNVASGIALCVIGLYLLFPTSSDLATRFSVCLSAYTSIMAATLAIDAFYIRTQAITDMDIFLKFLTNDLDEEKGRIKRLWIVYPALNIGYYRSLVTFKVYEDDEVLPENSPCDKFITALEARVKRLQKKANAITYPQELYVKLYQCYHEELRHPKPKPQKNSTNSTSLPENSTVLPEKCAKEAKRLFNLFDSSHAIEVPPDALPQHIIIIHDIVYTIMSYGIPIYNEVNQTFTSSESSGVADLIGW